MGLLVSTQGYSVSRGHSRWGVQLEENFTHLVGTTEEERKLLRSVERQVLLVAGGS